ncbi:MAG TPA: HSP90 family protein [Gemmataceae bacterium]|nr:HSP90 family protein [Gemmataceae bacterium]
MDHKFQINLRGIIDLLSHHLYSGPQVYLRELLQNGVDAIRARQAYEPGHRGDITVEVIPARDGRPPALAFVDNGIGLNEDEIHAFLATIGQTSKRGGQWERPQDFIGQFGIGLLSCFVVSDEIVVLTRSSRGDAPALEWRGRADGTYAVRTLQHQIAPGTQVYLTCKPGSEEFFEPGRVRDLAAHFGGLLPYPVRVTAGGASRVINGEGAPWRREYAGRREQDAALLEYGRNTFGIDFFDWVPLRSEAGQVEGVAYVLPFSPSLATRRTHRVYLKNMLLSESAENLLPDWAFFVKCVVNANDLRPMASREAFYEDEALAATREALGQCLRDYLVRLARQDPRRLQRLVGLHFLSIKALAVQDDEFYRLFIDWLPFETSMGDMTLAEYRRNNPVLRYVPDLDQFRQIARVAAAQGLCVINGAYTYNNELLEKFSEVFPDESVEVVDPSALTQSFEELDLRERDEVFHFIQTADRVLQPFKCSAEVKKFLPRELPTLYSTTAEAGFLRSVEQSREISDPLWSSVLGSLSEGAAAGQYAQLCFNYHNPLVRKVAAVKDRTLLQRTVQMLYVQALLLGHHPLSAREMALLNEGLIGLIEWGVDSAGPRRQP